MSHICVIDIETTGLCPVECGVIEIGAVMLSPTLEFVAEWSLDTRFFPEIQCWEAQAENVHGVTAEAAAQESRMHPVVAVDRLLDFVETYAAGERVVLAGMNLAGFDVQFLKAIMGRTQAGYVRSRLLSKWKRLMSHRTIDLHAVMAGVVLAKGGDVSKLYTDAIYEVLGMEAEPTPHRALTGARMEAEALKRAIAMLNGATPETLNPALDA
jgi:DNA polymerase III epsilon subunit-like protein